MSTTFTVETQLTTINCGNCGGTYAIQERYRQKKHEDCGSWNCPYCNVGWGYSGKTLAQKLQDQLDAEKRETERLRVSRNLALAEAEHFRKSRDGMKGALRKVSVRVKNGVCPCCNRTVKQMAAHMKTCHPEYKPETAE